MVRTDRTPFGTSWLLAVALTLVVALAGCSSGTAAGGAEGSGDEGSAVVAAVDAEGTATEADVEEEADPEAEPEPEYADEAFVDAVGKGLQDRWNITDSVASDAVDLEVMTEAVNAEKAAVEEFRDAEFQSTELAEAAQMYFGALDACDPQDYVKGNDMWSIVYNQRCEALWRINQVIPIEVRSEKQTTLEDMLATGEVSASVGDLMENVTFEAQPPEYEGDTWIEYQAVVENTSDVTYAYFSYSINLVDADGVVVETTEAWTENWEPGSKHRFEFSTDAEFDHVEIYGAEWNE